VNIRSDDGKQKDRNWRKPTPLRRPLHRKFLLLIAITREEHTHVRVGHPYQRAAPSLLSIFCAR
jgi:hypothetical protein